MPKAQFPKLTPAQLKLALDWVNARMRPVEDVLEELEQPRILEHLDRIGAQRLYPIVKEHARAAVLGIGGSNGMETFKPNPTNRDIDFFWFLKNPKLTPEQVSQLAAVMNRRLTDEIHEQRMKCTVEGLELEVDGVWRTFDVFKLGVVHNSIAWAVPTTCRHCMTLFYDGRFAPDGKGSFIHESCLATLPADS